MGKKNSTPNLSYIHACYVRRRNGKGMKAKKKKSSARKKIFTRACIGTKHMQTTNNRKGKIQIILWIAKIIELLGPTINQTYKNRKMKNTKNKIDK